MSAGYKILFLLELRHEYFKSKVSDLLEIVPSAETSATISNFGLILKTGRGFVVVLAKTKNDGTLLRPIPAETVFNFYLKPVSHYFGLLSNIKTEQGKKLFLTNMAGSEVSGHNYIGQPIAVYNASNDYSIGDLVKNGTNDVFEAIRPSNSGSPHNTADAAFWTNRGNTPFAGHFDNMDFVGNLHHFQTTVAHTHFESSAFRFNTSSGQFDLLAQTFEARDFDTATNSLPMNLGQLAPGRYRLLVNGESKIVYKDEHAMQPGVIGVIQIANHLSGSDNFSLLDNSGVVKENSFILHFANKSVLWIYKTRTANVTAITDERPAPQKINFINPEPQTFMSDRPVALTQQPVETLVFNSTVYGNISYLANPPTNNLKTIEHNGHTYFCLETFIPY